MRGVWRELKGLPRPVWLLGWVSLATDAATEAIYPLLPLFLTTVLGAGAVSLGIIEGAAEAANSVLKVAAGRLSDRRARKRPIVIAGYAISSLSRPLIAVATAWPHVLAIRFADRIGKGIRGAPRDALLAGWASVESRGLVYGFHRAMDHVGAIVGPLFATLFLFLYPGRLRWLFGLTIVPGVIAVLLLTRLQEPSATPRAGSAVPRPSAASWRDLPGSLIRFLAVMLLFTLGNSADAFLLLRLADVGVPAAAIPLWWSLLHVVKAGFSVAGGIVSDRFDRRSVVALGWIVYAVVYGAFAWTESRAALMAWFLVYGLYYGLTEGVEKAIVADLAPPQIRGTAFGVYYAVLGIGAFIASVAFGFVWKTYGAPVAFGLGAALALVASLMLFAAVPRAVRAEAV
jgi:MFS family permease